MKRKVLIVLILAMLLGCLSIPVFAKDRDDYIIPSYKACCFWTKHYEQLVFYQPGGQTISYNIRTRDKNGKKLDEDYDYNVTASNKCTFSTASSTKAKSGYYSYKTYHIGTTSVIWSKSDIQY